MMRAVLLKINTLLYDPHIHVESDLFLTRCDLKKNQPRVLDSQQLLVKRIEYIFILTAR